LIGTGTRTSKETEGVDSGKYKGKGKGVRRDKRKTRWGKISPKEAPNVGHRRKKRNHIYGTLKSGDKSNTT